MNERKLNKHSYAYITMRKAQKQAKRADMLETLQAMLLFFILIVDTIMMLALFGK